MLKIRDDVDLKEMEKFGFRKHKQDDENICVSKWTRRWIEADTIDGYSCGSSGWEFYPAIEIYEDRKIKVYIEDHWGGLYTSYLDILFDLIKAGLVDKVEEKL